MRIYIPTRGRVNNQITLGEIPEPWRANTCLVTAPDQFDELDQMNYGVDILCLPDDVRGMPNIRQWILDHSDDKHFVMMDDDLTLHYRDQDNIGPSGRAPILRSTPSIVSDMFKDLEEWLISGITHCGITPRFLNWDNNALHIECTRMLHILAYNKDVVRATGAKFNKGVTDWQFTMEDFHMTIQLLRAGHKNRVSLAYCSNPSPSNAPGGISTFRSLESHNNSAVFLQAQHPMFVRVRDKSNASWGGFEGTRKDVSVQWQKAYRSSQPCT